MQKNNCHIYLVEGETEEKMIKILKDNYIISGSIKIIHQKRIRPTLLRLIPRSAHAVMIFDTDVPAMQKIIHENIKTLKNNGICVLLIPQIKNLEDEIIFSTSIKNIKELLDSKSQADFKSDFLKEKHCLKKLEEKNFDIKKYWSRSPDVSSVFYAYKNNAEKIKILNKPVF